MWGHLDNNYHPDSILHYTELNLVPIESNKINEYENFPDTHQNNYKTTDYKIFKILKLNNGTSLNIIILLHVIIIIFITPLSAFLPHPSTLMLESSVQSSLEST